MLLRQSTILVIDDQSLNVMLMEEFLRPSGYRILFAHSGPEGMIIALSEKPALILLDIMMKGEDGITTLRLLKNNPETANIPVIIISTCTDACDSILGLDNMATDYIAKPYNGREVLARVVACLGMHEKIAMKAHPELVAFNEL